MLIIKQALNITKPWKNTIGDRGVRCFWGRCRKWRRCKEFSGQRSSSWRTMEETMTTDNKEHLQEVLDAIEEEGIDYAFNNLSGFSNIKDEEFHRLRRAYCKAGNIS